MIVYLAGGRCRAEGMEEGDSVPLLSAGHRLEGHTGLEWAEAMTVASRLLVDLSTLQTFFQAPMASTVLEDEESGIIRNS